MKNLALLFALTIGLSSYAQESNSPLVSFEDYEKLMSEVKDHRRTRLVDLNEFNRMSAKDEVYILDTRSKEMYDRKHVKGAIHLNFSDFTQDNLDALFPNRNATILIYCNNNFYGDLQVDPITLSEFVLPDENFASKVSYPDFSALDDSTMFIQGYTSDEKEALNQSGRSDIKNVPTEEIKSIPISTESSITLALNIPTYINLYGYGYKNVYELSELVSVYDSRIQFEGTEVIPVEN